MKSQTFRAAIVIALIAIVGCNGSNEKEKQASKNIDTNASQEASGTIDDGVDESALIAAEKRKSWRLPPARKIVVGNTAPEITAMDIDGVEFNLSDYRGKVVMVDFWGDW